MTVPPERLAALYARPVRSTRGGPVFNAHSYPTKISPDAVAACIVAHTDPGDVVLDGFSGSGSVGFGATVCGRPSDALRADVADRVGDVSWGERDVELVDLGGLASFISGTLLSGVDPDAFHAAATALMATLEAELGWVYAAVDDRGEPGQIRHTVWTDHVVLAGGKSDTYWNLAVDLDPAGERPVRLGAGASGIRRDLSSAPRVCVDVADPLLGGVRRTRVRSPAMVYGRTGRRTWRRRATDADAHLIDRVRETPLPDCVPVLPMMGHAAGGSWGEMFRSGYHQGITHLHHFYTHRNLLVVGRAWALADAAPPALRDALRLWISSYNATHSTLMTRVVAKKDAVDLVVTGAQPGALYVSSLPVEKNIISGLRRKCAVLRRAFAALYGRGNRVRVQQRSVCDTGLADASVDYIFTDPPFGANIQYAEVNFISEAWLGRVTERTEEVIVSPHQGKRLSDYGALLTGAFREYFRVLKPGRYMTVAFHSTRADVWDVLRRAWEDAGFVLARFSVLDKDQRSFKQVTTRGAVSQDPLVLLRKPSGGPVAAVSRSAAPVLWPWVEARLRTLPVDDPNRARDRLWGAVVTTWLGCGLPPPIDASGFFQGLETRAVERDGLVHLRGADDRG